MVVCDLDERISFLNLEQLEMIGLLRVSDHSIPVFVRMNFDIIARCKAIRSIQILKQVFCMIGELCACCDGARFVSQRDLHTQEKKNST